MYIFACLYRNWQLQLLRFHGATSIAQGGYREGLDQGKEKTIQQGFDSGKAPHTTDRVRGMS